MTYNGYPVRGSPIFGTNNRYLGDDDIPYATLSYANGPGYRKEVNGSRVDVSKEDMGKFFCVNILKYILLIGFINL